MSATSASQEDHVFLAKMDNVHNLVTVLKAVNFKEVSLKCTEAVHSKDT